MNDVACPELVGGHPAVDFVNTPGGDRDTADEYPPSYVDLVRLFERLCLIEPTWADQLRALAAEDPADADRVLAAARRLRANVDEVLRAALAGREAPTDALDGIRAAYVEAVRNAELHLVHAGESRAYEWTYADPPPVLSSILWPLALSIVELLRSDELEDLKCCDDCRWLFLDKSRNRSRRWCSMRACGAHAKMRRYRAGRKAR